MGVTCCHCDHHEPKTVDELAKERTPLSILSIRHLENPHSNPQNRHCDEETGCHHGVRSLHQLSLDQKSSIRVTLLFETKRNSKKFAQKSPKLEKIENCQIRLFQYFFTKQRLLRRSSI